ncbi:hypothetical protein LCGC14_0288840 [marine sediment metagenome]|uniref:Uncharacterized protein n=1 Tax=marine sediment metagenome TaxID=412755 RepID=A0A0F9UAQ0_9ZZZZ
MKWFLTSKNIDEIVEASDQWQAFDSLQNRSVDDFGLIVEAQPVRETRAESFGVRTSLLFGRWGRTDEARKLIKAGVRCGLPDTTEKDIPRNE